MPWKKPAGGRLYGFVGPNPAPAAKEIGEGADFGLRLLLFDSLG